MLLSSDVIEGNVKELEIKSIIGFDGTTMRGFLVHPNGTHVIYALGNKVIIQEWVTKKQKFLSGHTNIISAIDVSKSGKYIASGQINHIGFRALVIVWEFDTGNILGTHELHKVRVEAIIFSRDERYCLSLGGRDCGFVVVWDIESKQPLCGTSVSRGIQGEAITVLPTNLRGACFITGGDNHLSIWKIVRDTRNVVAVDVNTRKLKRFVLCMDLNDRDEICYCGTTTGDVIKIRLQFHHDPEILDPVKPPCVIGCFARITKQRLPRGTVSLYSQGVTMLKLLPNATMIIGAGDGLVELVEESKPQKQKDIGIAVPSAPCLKILKSTRVNNSVTSIQFMGNKILCGTRSSEIFAIDMDVFDAELLVTCHINVIYDIAFPFNFSDVFATASNNVRIWNVSTTQELLRINVPNFSCSTIIFSYDGKSILTAWNDGVIRSFTPLTGRLIYAIPNAHNKGVSALTITRKGDTLVSGGCEGQVRVWSITPFRQELICTLKEHKAPISSLHLNRDDTEAVSASTDGSCIIWDIKRLYRRQILFANTLFMCARYYPTGVQILTCGSDRKLAYWEVLDGTLVREIEGSSSGAINSLDIAENGEVFVTGGNDQIVKLWRYQEGITTHIGVGHSAVITETKFSPDGKLIISASGSGSIFIWKMPNDFIEKSKEPEPASARSPKDKDEHIEDLPSVRSNKSNASSKSISSKFSCKPCSECSSSSSLKNGAKPKKSSKTNLLDTKKARSATQLEGTKKTASDTQLEDTKKAESTTNMEETVECKCDGPEKK